MLGDVKLPYNNSKRNTTGMGHNCLHVRFVLLDLDSDLDLLTYGGLGLGLEDSGLGLGLYCCWTCYKSAQKDD